MSPSTYDAAFARAVLPTPAFQKLQQQQLAQGFLAQRSACPPELCTRQQTNSLIQQAVAATTSSPPIQQTATMESTNQADVPPEVQPAYQALEEAGMSKLPANAWTQDKVSSNQWTHDKQLHCAEIKPLLLQTVREQLNSKFGRTAQPQIHNALRRKGYHIQEKPSNIVGAWFSNSYLTKHGVNFTIMGGPDCLSDNGQHVFETKARMGQRP